jgi:hypothetical protein
MIKTFVSAKLGLFRVAFTSISQALLELDVGLLTALGVGLDVRDTMAFGGEF